MKIFKALLATSILLMFSFSQSLAAKPAPPGGHLNIEEVAVTIGDPNTTLEIMGTDFDFGGTLEVTLAGTPAAITSSSSTTITATVLTASFPAGDYLLTVSRGNGQSQNDEYDLTIGSPDISQEVCSLYGLTGFPAPPSLVSESPEATCDDGLDNDCDGDTDGADSDCAVVECPCADNYAEAITVYTAEGGNLDDGWALCANDVVLGLVESRDVTVDVGILLSTFPTGGLGTGRCGVEVVRAVDGGGTVLLFVPPILIGINEGEHAACVALQESICNPP